MKRYITLFVILLLGFTKLNAQCNTVNSISENFDDWKSIQPCWETYSGLSMIYAKNKRITFYSLMTPKEDMYLVTPKLKAGNYTISFDISDNGGLSTLEFFSVLDSKNKKSFKSMGKATEIKGGRKVQNFKLAKDAHLGLKIVLNDMHQAVYADNFIIQSRK